jgi:Ca-activated chloride channel homolog
VNLDQMFLNSERLWWLLLIPILVAVYIYLSRRKNRSGMRFTNTGVLGAVVPVQSQWRRHLAVALSLLSLVTLTIAWSRPSGIDHVPRERATIVLILDISQSMAATDVKPNRLDAAKAEAKDFVTSLPTQYNVALVSLSGNPAARMPPTQDRGQVGRAIDALALQDSTAIGDSINVAMATLQSAPKAADGSTPPGAIVMLSDGQNTAGRSPTQEAAEAAKAKVPIYTIAFGNENGYVDLDGKREKVPPDKALLQRISTLTNGRAFTAESVSQLDSVYKNIRSEVGYEEVRKEVTATWAGYGLAFAVIAALAAVSLGARWP